MTSAQDRTAGSPGGSTARSCFLVFGLYLVLAVVLTWPLVARMGTHVPMGNHDVWQNYWNFWWWKQALIELHQSPYRTDMIFHPVFRDDPAHLGCHTHSPANVLLTLPVNAIFGISAALDLAVFAGFVLAGFGLFLLAREYGAAPGAAFVGGVVFAYFPQHVEQSLEHLNLASVHALPLFLWALVRLVRRGGWPWVLLGGAFYSLAALSSWHHGLLAVSLGAVVALFETWKGRRRILPVLGGLAAAGAVAAILVSPFLWQLWQAAASGEAIVRKPSPPKPIDPLFLVIPHSGHPLWGDALAPIYEEFRSYPSVGFVAYLGISVLALACVAPLGERVGRLRAAADAPGVAPRHSVWLWVAIFLFFLLLSLGETLTVAREEFPAVPVPFRWLKAIPLFGIVRVPNRFLVAAVLALAVLAALGSGTLAALVPRRHRAWSLAGAAALVLVDFMWLPYPMREVPRPQWLSLLAPFDPRAVVLDIPSGHTARAAEDMLLQTMHGHPIASGYTASPLTRVGDLLERYPVLRRAFERYPPPAAYGGPPLADAIRDLGIDIVILHLDRSVTRIRERREALRERYPRDLYRIRIENPEVGTPEATLGAFREELIEAFGEPVARHGDEIEIYATSQ